MIVLVLLFLINSFLQMILLKNDRRKVFVSFVCFLDSIVLILLLIVQELLSLCLYIVFIMIFVIVIKTIIMIKTNSLFKKNMKKKIALLVTSIIFLLLVIPYGKVEINTFIYGKVFESCYKLTNSFEKPDYYKVIYVKNKEAKILYGNRESEIVLYMKKKNKKWKYDNWETVWSCEGSADGVIYPFYR